MTYTDEDVERVARAICTGLDLDPNETVYVGGGISQTQWREYVNSARAALSAIPRQTVPEWRPIKSAPKNNTKVLIYVPPMAKEGSTGYPEIIMVSRFKGYWWDAGHLNPTHWMPLPTPPTQEGK